MPSTTLPGVDQDQATSAAGETATRPRVAAWRAALSGAAAAAAALAAGELVTAVLDSGPSLVTAVGSEFVDRFAASLKQLAVSLFGTNDKTALVVGIVVSSVVLGAALGIAARRRWLVAPLGIAAFGVLGAWALWSNARGATGTALAAAAVSIAVGVGCFTGLWHLARHAVRTGGARHAPATAPPRRRVVDRRGFVLGVGGVVVGAGAAALAARRLRSVRSVDAARRSTVLPRPAGATPTPSSQPFSVPGLSSYVTSNADFYRIDTALSTPQVSVTGWRLSVTGLVNQPYELTYEELLDLDSVEETVTIACVSNEVGGRLVGNAVWQGVPLAVLLDRAGVETRATQIVGRSVDGWTAGFPTAEALDGRTALVAYAMNGEPLPAAHGYPARLIVAGLYGYVSATKWLEEIELTTWEAFDGYWVPRGWSKEGPIKTASRIDVPRASATLDAGRQPIAGVAWAPDRGIELVEVQIDGGPWQPCELGRAASDDTWVQWRYVWPATPGDHTVRVRATDGDGVTQTEEDAAPAPDGASGWHSRRFGVT